ncbi:MAG: biotin transporter BioY [Pseudomonadota bacterium]
MTVPSVSANPITTWLWSLDRPSRWIRLLFAVVCGSALLVLSAKIQVPMPFVPATLQTGAVAFLALVLGFRLAMVTLAVYFAQGIVGLPVFSAGGGWAYLITSPTAGFLWGFALIIAVVAILVRTLPPAFGRWHAPLAGLIGIYAVYLPGVMWLRFVFGDWSRAFEAGFWPFILGDAIKGLLAGCLALVLVRLTRNLIK